MTVYIFKTKNLFIDSLTNTPVNKPIFVFSVLKEGTLSCLFIRAMSLA